MRTQLKQRRRWLLPATLFGLSLGACTTTELVNYNDTPIDLNRDSEQVPMKVISVGHGAGYFTIPVLFQNTLKECMVDTGSTVSHVYSADPFFNDLPEAGRFWGAGLSGSTPSFVVQTKTLEIGGLTLHDVNFVRHDEALTSYLGYPCIIGMNVLSHGIIRLDFSKKKFQLLNKFPANLKKETLVVFNDGHFGVPFQLGALSLKTMFDTGASMTFVEPQVIESNHGHFGAQLSAEEGMDIATKDFKYSTREMTGVVFGSSQVQKHVVGVTEVSFAINSRYDAIVGFDLIRNSNWLIDVHGGSWANF